MAACDDPWFCIDFFREVGCEILKLLTPKDSCDNNITIAKSSMLHTG